MFAYYDQRLDGFSIATVSHRCSQGSERSLALGGRPAQSTREYGGDQLADRAVRVRPIMSVLRESPCRLFVHAEWLRIKNQCPSPGHFRRRQALGVGSPEAIVLEALFTHLSRVEEVSAIDHNRSPHQT